MSHPAPAACPSPRASDGTGLQGPPTGEFLLETHRGCDGFRNRLGVGLGSIDTLGRFRQLSFQPAVIPGESGELTLGRAEPGHDLLHRGELTFHRVHPFTDVARRCN